jgi:teichuronic acid biosynthesis glycosyltransferase TuaG
MCNELYGIKDIKVSVVTPVFNSEKFLAQTIISVMKQTHPNWELIITDDFSTDHSLKIAESYAAKDSRIKTIKLNVNSGSGVARNHSIGEATGEVIAFLDADDLWDEDFLEKSLRFMEKYQAGIVFSSYRRASEDLNDKLGEFIVPEFTNYHEMLKSCSISCLTGIYHVNRCKGKAYMPDIRRRQDYCLWLTLLKRIDRAYGLSDVLATYRICSKSVSRNKIKVAIYQWYVYRKIERLPLLTSCFYFIHYFIRGFIKNYALLGQSLFTK